jgi:hypothetical protein
MAPARAAVETITAYAFPPQGDAPVALIGLETSGGKRCSASAASAASAGGDFDPRSGFDATWFEGGGL